MRVQVWIWIAAVAASVAAGGWLWPDDAANSPAPVAAAPASHAQAWGPSPFADGAPAANATPHRHLTDPLPPALFARSGRIVDLQGMTAVQYIALYSSLARTGDADAAYKVFLAADVCAVTNEPLPKMEPGEDMQAMQKERSDLEKICRDVTPAQVAERMSFLDAAARAGNHNAQIDFYMEGPNGGARQAGSEDEAKAQWKNQSLAYLKEAASGGDTFSLGLLANAYDAGILSDPDAKLSLAYTVADMMTRNRPASPAALQRRFGGQLSEADFNAGMQMGAQIAAQCCGR